MTRTITALTLLTLLCACGEDLSGDDVLRLAADGQPSDDSMDADVVRIGDPNDDDSADMGPYNPTSDAGEPDDVDAADEPVDAAAPGCVAGESTCSEDGASRFVCDGSTGEIVEERCPDGSQCADGQCMDGVEASRGVTCDTIECLSERSTALVCGRFTTDIAQRTRNPFQAGPGGQCDPGGLTDAAYSEALGVVNYARWLTGLAEVTFDEGLHPRTQACATIMANQRALSHRPPQNWACYTAEGAQAAAESNIHLSSRSESIVESVMGYLHDGGDNNRADVGHRRWLQSPTLGRVGFGYHHSQTTGASSSCYNVIASDAGPRTGPPFIAYPNAGTFPIELITSRWWTLPWSVSIHARFRDSLPPTEAWSIQVWRLEGESMDELSVNYVNASDTWYGRNHAVVFSPEFEVTPGRYRVLVEAPGHRYEWTTELVRCAN